MSIELPPIDWSGPWVPYRPASRTWATPDDTFGDYGIDHGHDDAFYGTDHTGAPTYGWCKFCPNFTYRDLWQGACGDCLWRWHHFPDVMPVHLRRYRSEMPVVCSRPVCSDSDVCPVYGQAVS